MSQTFLPRFLRCSLRYLNRDLMILGTIFLAVLGYLIYWHHNERQELTERFLRDQKAIAHEKREVLENMMTGVYQNLRTISLLPSVRAIAGGNRINESEDVVATGRLTQEAHATVQQIYNNLSTRVSVSEVYAVVEGLDAGKGEIPFFMFDKVLFGDVPVETEAPKPADFPEESEDAEYAYFPQQIARAKALFPDFRFRHMDDIPALLSPLMRTCDNSQYISRQQNNEKDSHGLLYSVPFYSPSGSLRGVISAILRANVLEALLLGVPFIPVTETDRAEQAKAGWSLPDPSRYVLSNEKYGIRIVDRRNPQLDPLIAAGQAERNVFHLPLKIPGDAPWVLTYYLPEEAISESLAAHDRTFLILLTVVVGSMVAAGIASTLLNRIRLRLGGSTEEVAVLTHQVRDGNLCIEVPPDTASESVLGSMEVMAETLSGHMRAIDQESKQIGLSSYQIAEISTHIVNTTHREKAHADEVRSAMEVLAHTTESVRHLAENVLTHADRARLTAEEGITAVHENISEMQKVIHEVSSADEKIAQLNSANEKIQRIVHTIIGITDQTNLLALNAAIEAARAGEQGRGFAVVADEVRKLAQHAGQATSEISTIIHNLTHLVAENTEAMQRVITRTQSSMAKAEGSRDVIERIVSVIDGNAQAAHEISGVSAEQNDKVDTLQVRLDNLMEALNGNSLKVHTAGAIGQDLFHVTERLRTLVHHFRFDERRVIKPIPNEHRKLPRYNNHLLVSLDDHGKEREALTVDISLSGARLRTPLPLQSAVGEKLPLKIILPAASLETYRRQSPLAITATLLWNSTTAEGECYGVEFGSPTSEQVRQLQRCFDFFNQQATYAKQHEIPVH